MTTRILNIAVAALFLEAVAWTTMPLVAQSIEQRVPIRPHETEEVYTGVPTRTVDVSQGEEATDASLFGDIRIRRGKAAHKPPKEARKEFDRGVKAWRKGRREEAFQYFSTAVSYDPDYLEAQAYLGQLCLQEGEPLKALAYLDQAVVLEPKSDALHSNRAWALLALRRAQEAEQASRRALDLKSNSVTAHYLLGLALLQQSRVTEETARHLEIAVRRYPDARLGLEWVQEQLGISKRQ